MILKKKLVIEYAISSETMVDRYAKSYEKFLNTGLGRKQKMINRGLFVFASAAVVAAGVSVAAPWIAVALKGSGFAGLQGASIVSASLVALGGETIAIGGKGIVSGLATRVGGGALLGGLTGGAVASATHLLSKTSPEVIISQGAKLSVVMKEIILNSQQDTLNA